MDCLTDKLGEVEEICSSLRPSEVDSEKRAETQSLSVEMKVAVEQEVKVEAKSDERPKNPFDKTEMEINPQHGETICKKMSDDEASNCSSPSLVSTVRDYSRNYGIPGGNHRRNDSAGERKSRSRNKRRRDYSADRRRSRSRSKRRRGNSTDREDRRRSPGRRRRDNSTDREDRRRSPGRRRRDNSTDKEDRKRSPSRRGRGYSTDRDSRRRSKSPGRRRRRSRSRSRRRQDYSTDRECGRRNERKRSVTPFRSDRDTFERRRSRSQSRDRMDDKRRPCRNDSSERNLNQLEKDQNIRKDQRNESPRDWSESPKKSTTDFEAAPKVIEQKEEQKFSSSRTTIEILRSRIQSTLQNAVTHTQPSATVTSSKISQEKYRSSETKSTVVDGNGSSEESVQSSFKMNIDESIFNKIVSTATSSVAKYSNANDDTASTVNDAIQHTSISPLITNIQSSKTLFDQIKDPRIRRMIQTKASVSNQNKLDQRQSYEHQPNRSQPHQLKPHQLQPHQFQPHQLQPHQLQPHQLHPHQLQPYPFQSFHFQPQPYQYHSFEHQVYQQTNQTFESERMSMQWGNYRGRNMKKSAPITYGQYKQQQSKVSEPIPMAKVSKLTPTPKANMSKSIPTPKANVPESVPIPKASESISVPELSEPIPAPELSEPIPAPELSEPIPSPQRILKTDKSNDVLKPKKTKTRKETTDKQAKAQKKLKKNKKMRKEEVKRTKAVETVTKPKPDLNDTVNEDIGSSSNKAINALKKMVNPQHLLTLLDVMQQMSENNSLAEMKEALKTCTTDEDIGNARPIEQQLGSTTIGSVGKARLNNELRRLNEDINNMFIRDGVLNAKGRRRMTQMSGNNSSAEVKVALKTCTSDGKTAVNITGNARSIKKQLSSTTTGSVGNACRNEEINSMFIRDEVLNAKGRRRMTQMSANNSLAEVKEALKTCTTDEATGNARSIKKQLSSTTTGSVGNASRKNKNELEKLHEDINNMFIRDGVLNANGRRSGSKSYTESSMDDAFDDEQEVGSPSPASSKKASSKKASGKKAFKQKSSNKNLSVKASSQKTWNKKAPGTIHMQVVSTPTTPNAKEKLREGVVPVVLLTRLAIRDPRVKNSNPDWHSLKNALPCQICYNPPGSSLVSHYVNFHPNDEVLNSRLSPEAAQCLRSATDFPQFEEMRRDGSVVYKQFCYFCNTSGIHTKTDWIRHMMVHTGYYDYKCNGCLRQFSTRATYHTCHPNSTIEKINQPIFQQANIMAYVCELCNYVRFHEEEIQKHLDNEHDDDDEVKEFKKFKFFTLPIKSNKDGRPRKVKGFDVRQEAN